ncbi:MAG: class I SAM-dependent methyltransferase [Candidatus Methanomethylophilaceae archaeon]|nr:class I SAM-dependent methyltransferase [Candidatus Methanomethylophilaceae archaeon]
MTDFEKGMMYRIAGYEQLRIAVDDAVVSRIASPSSWLDTGCGTGGSIRLSVERHPGTRFTLADPSEDNLAKVKETIGAYGYAAGPTHLLDFPDSSFDAITSILSHHYYSDREQKRKAVSNCFRMLREGGVYVTVEHTVHPGEQDSYDREWASYMRGRGLSEDRIEEMFARRDTVYFPMPEDELKALILSCGFSEAEVFWRSCSDVGIVAVK